MTELHKGKYAKPNKIIFNKAFVCIAAIFVILVISAIIVTSFVIRNSSINDSSVVVSVNGEQITFGEYRQNIISNRALVYGYFKGKYKADDSKGFWTKNFNGEVPLDKIKQDALDNCIKTKVQQILARQKGLIKDITYDKFLKDLKAENERRKKAIRNNEVIYGPEQYSESAYYSVVNSNLTADLKKALQAYMKITEGEMELQYEKIIQEQIIGAKVIINEKVYNRIGVKYVD